VAQEEGRARDVPGGPLELAQRECSETVTRESEFAILGTADTLPSLETATQKQQKNTNTCNVNGCCVHVEFARAQQQEVAVPRLLCKG
jgi:hypothetical protein